MPVQDVLLKGVEIPEGYETTGEHRVPVRGDFIFGSNPSCDPLLADGGYSQPRLILRKIEPDEVKLAKLVSATCSWGSPACGAVKEMAELADRVLAKHKEQSK